ncbi:hypothetical protein BaRGS_00022384, partial [Batillaria attramentaria]
RYLSSSREIPVIITRESCHHHEGFLSSTQELSVIIIKDSCHHHERFPSSSREIPVINTGAFLSPAAANLQWVSFGSCSSYAYGFSTDTKTYDGAKLSCSSQDGNVWLANLDDDFYLLQTYKGSETVNYWVNGQGTAGQKSTFRWGNGNTIDDAYWAANEPSSGDTHLKFKTYGGSVMLKGTTAVNTPYTYLCQGHPGPSAVIQEVLPAGCFALTTEKETTTQEDPTTTREVPTTTQEVPTTTQEVPTTTQEDPTTTQEDPTTTQEDPTTTQEDPTTTQDDPTTTQEVPTTTQGNPTTTHEDPTTTARDITTVSQDLSTAAYGFLNTSWATTGTSCCACMADAVRKSDDQVTEEIARVQRELTVDKSNLSATVRRKTSARDSRLSAQTTGLMGVVLLVVVAAIIFLSDLKALLMCRERGRHQDKMYK